MDADALRAMAASMPVIEQAKGIVMGCYGVDATAAFGLLTRVSSTTNLKLRTLAATVVETASNPGGSTPGPGSSSCDQVRQVFHGKAST